jgi:hypothetical protein
VSLFVKINIPALATKSYQEVRSFDRDLLQELNRLSLNLESILNRGLRFEDNVDCRLVSVVSHVTPGTQFSVAHGLGKTPVGYIVSGQGAAGDLYDGSTPNDATTLYLKSSGSAVTFRLIVF